MHFQVHHIISFTKFHFPNVAFYELFDSLNCLIWKLESALFRYTWISQTRQIENFFFFWILIVTRYAWWEGCYDQWSPDNGNISIELQRVSFTKADLIFSATFCLDTFFQLKMCMCSNETHLWSIAVCDDNLSLNHHEIFIRLSPWPQLSSAAELCILLLSASKQQLALFVFVFWIKGVG